MKRERMALDAERIAALWPTTSIRDIASELDVTAKAIEYRALKMGLPRRPFSYQPIICAEV